jgi:hypothetical protein
VQANTEANALIDGSKYAGRLYHLGKVFGTPTVRVVHIVRDPIDMARSMRGSEQGESRSKPAALLYYFMVNGMIKMVLSRLRLRSAQIWYEELIADPEESLRMIAQGCGVDTQQSILKVCTQQPLDRGFIFNGNRMRLEESVVLKRTGPRDRSSDSAFDRAVARAARWLFG